MEQTNQLLRQMLDEESEETEEMFQDWLQTEWEQLAPQSKVALGATSSSSSKQPNSQ